MKDEIIKLLKHYQKNYVSSKTATAELLAKFDHIALFKIISEYMDDDSMGRFEWIIGINVLCRINRVEANKRFISALQVDDADKRFRIVKLLGSCGTEHIVPTLITMLKDDPEEGIRFMIADTLGAIGDLRALDMLEWSLENDTGTNHEGTSVAYVARKAIERIKSS